MGRKIRINSKQEDRRQELMSKQEIKTNERVKKKKKQRKED